jgi:hypothetical protein
MLRKERAGDTAGHTTRSISRSNHNNNIRPKLRGDNQCQCGGCGELFASVGTFDRHRIGEGMHRRCLSVAEMLAKGWIRNGRCFWIRGHRSGFVSTLPQPAQERRSGETLAGERTRNSVDVLSKRRRVLSRFVKEEA